MLNDQTLLQYLHQTLGVNYLSHPSFAAVMGKSAEALSPESTDSDVAKDLPLSSSGTVPPQLVFINYDTRDIHLSAQHQEVFDKMVKAMGLDPDHVWRVQSEGHELPDVLNRLRLLKVQAPVVVMKTDPEIFEAPQQMGVHSWVECFSVSEMVAKPQTKKATWKVLQYFIKKG